MSAPFRPAAFTCTNSSPDPGSGSGCSSTESSPSRTVTAFTAGIFPRSPEKGVRISKQGGSQIRQPVYVSARCRAGDRRIRSVPPRMQLPHPYVPPMWREGRIGLELTGLLRSGVWRGEGVADGGDQPVMLVSGLLAGDNSLNFMARWLKNTGHRPCRAGIAVNVDCSERAVDRLERRLECLAEDSGQKVAVVGQSRGGSFARVLAVRRPDLVSGVTPRGSPPNHQLAVHPFVPASVPGMGALGTFGVDGLMRRSCLGGACCTKFWDAFAEDFPAG